MNFFKRFSVNQIYKSFLFLLLGLAPCIICSVVFLRNFANHNYLKQQIHSLHKKIQLDKIQSEEATALINRLKACDPDYIQNTLEKETFLNKEIKRLKVKTLHNQGSLEDKNRLRELEKKANSLRFHETDFEILKNWQEVQIHQEKEIEVDKDDLIQLLSTLENSKIDEFIPDSRAPFFLINYFQLDRAPKISEEEAFRITLKCIKREYKNE